MTTVTTIQIMANTQSPRSRRNRQVITEATSISLFTQWHTIIRRRPHSRQFDTLRIRTSAPGLSAVTTNAHSVIESAHMTQKKIMKHPKQMSVKEKGNSVELNDVTSDIIDTPLSW